MSTDYTALEDYLNNRQEAEEQRREQEHDEAIERWTDDLMIYAADVVSQHAKDWVMYALAIRDGDPNPQEPVLPPAPTHPDLVPSEPVDLSAEVPA
jgi:hypothetical protein